MGQIDILNTIHKRCANYRKFHRIDNSSISNLVICTYSETDAITKEFCDAVLQGYFESAHMLRFLTYRNLETAISSAASYGQQILDAEFAQGVNWNVKIVLVLSNEMLAIEHLRSYPYTRVLLLETENNVANAEYYEQLVHVPCRVNELEQAMQTVAVYLLAMIQGVEISPYVRDDNVIRNRLYGYFYDCIEQRVRCETAETLAGLLCDAEDEKERFRQAVERSADTSALGAACYVVDTAGYERIAAQIQMNLPTSFFKRLLCRLSKRYREKNITWSGNGIKCEKVVEQLLGSKFLTNAANAQDSWVTAHFAQWWNSGRDKIINTTLKILTSAVQTNGLLSGWQEEVGREVENQWVELLNKKEALFAPQGRSLNAIMQAISSVTSLVQQIHELNLMRMWYGFVNEQISGVIQTQNLLSKQEQYGYWLTQLNDKLATNVKAVYSWAIDPVALPKLATLEDRNDNQFDIDAGMMWLRNKVGHKTGQCLLLASNQYNEAGWGKPSERKNSISNIKNDKFSLLDGLHAAQLVLLCMDA